MVASEHSVISSNLPMLYRVDQPTSNVVVFRGHQVKLAQATGLFPLGVAKKPTVPPPAYPTSQPDQRTYQNTGPTTYTTTTATTTTTTTTTTAPPKTTAYQPAPPVTYPPRRHQHPNYNHPTYPTYRPSTYSQPQYAPVYYYYYILLRI